MNILKKIADYFFHNDIAHGKIIQRKHDYLSSLDSRQLEIYNNLIKDETPLRELLLSLEKRIYNLEKLNNHDI